MRPLLFLDVDGPLIPFGGVGGYQSFGEPDPHNPLLDRIDPALGPRLAALGGELVWATSWMNEANASVAPRLGLPPLPVVGWPDEAPEDGLHWKTRGLRDRAAGRAFAWIDDEIGGADRDWVAAHHPGPALLHRVDARRGLTGADFDALGAWCTAHRRVA